MVSRLAHRNHGLARSRVAKAVEDYRTPRRCRDLKPAATTRQVLECACPLALWRADVFTTLRVFFTMTLPNPPRKRWRPTALQDATATSGLP